MATTPSSGDAVAINLPSSPPQLATIARELRQQILIEVFRELIHNDTIEYILYCAKVEERDRDPPSITKQAQDLVVALPELKNDIAFVEQKARDSFHENKVFLSQVVPEVIRADEKRDIAGYIGCDTVQIYMRMGGQLSAKSSGEENLCAMELWWKKNLESTINRLQFELVYYVLIFKDGLTCRNSTSCGCLKCCIGRFRNTHRRFCILEALVNGQFGAFDELVQVGQVHGNSWKIYSPHW